MFRIRKANGGTTPLTYQKFTSVLLKLGLPSEPEKAPTSIPDACKSSFSSSEFKVPTLEDLKVNTDNLGPHLYPGGETESLDRLNKYTSRQVCYGKSIVNWFDAKIFLSRIGYANSVNLILRPIV